jgi:RNA polymerase sigma factor (sigma-70 family)
VKLSNLPPPSREEERALIARAQAGDLAARNELVERHFPLIFQHTRRAKRWGFSVEESIGVAVQAFIYVLGIFDLARGVRLSTYAVPVIRHQVSAWCFEHTGSLRVTRAYAGKKREDVPNHIRTLVAAAKKPSISIDATAATSKGEAGRTIAETIADREAPPSPLEGLPSVGKLRRAIALLEPRQREIMRRRLRGEILQEVGDALGVTKERVRQIELQAKERLKWLLTCMPDQDEDEAAR